VHRERPLAEPTSPHRPTFRMLPITQRLGDWLTSVSSIT
jgi:hypothetical protein